MRNIILSIRGRMDQVGVLLSGLCLLHCIAGMVLVAGLGLGGEVLLSPAIHRIGLALAIIVAVITLGLGAARHGQRAPLLSGAAGIALMAVALLVGHGVTEAVLTVAGVSLVAFAHIRNLRSAA